jgi:adenylyl- and sulfurtransferase ThiI
MEFDHLLVRYGELTLKGTNRKKFVNALKDNVIKSLQTIEGTLMTLSFKAFTNFFRFVPFKVSSPYLTNK